MTVDELIGKLREEWQRVEGMFNSAYDNLGRVVYSNRNSRSCPQITEAIDEVGELLDRQREINDLIANIREESRK